MNFTEEQRAEIKDAILIRCSGTDYQTFQIEELDRMVGDVGSLVNENFVLAPVIERYYLEVIYNGHTIEKRTSDDKALIESALMEIKERYKEYEPNIKYYTGDLISR